MATSSLPTNGTGYISFISPQALETAPVSVDTVKLLIQMDAAIYGVSKQEMDDVVSCESGYDQYALGDYVNGKPTSFGAVQIHNPLSKSPPISIYQAENIFFALAYLANGIKTGSDHWSCETKTGWNTS